MASRVTKQDFYVDESFSMPMKADPGSAQRSTTQVPKFPIRRRPTNQAASSKEQSLPKSKCATNEIHFDAPKETPTKTAGHTNLARKVEFRTPSAMAFESTNGSHITSTGVSSILNVRSSVVELASTNSTTPHGTPQPLSPKVFDFSDSEDPTLNLFTPRKVKLSSHDRVQTEKRTNIYKPSPSEVQTPEMHDQVTIPCLALPPMQTPNSHIHKPQKTSHSDIVERTQNHQQDIIVPIKDACPGNVSAEYKSTSSVCSSKPSRVDKTSTGPLHGVIAYVDVRTADGDDASAPFTEALRNMGAKVVRQWSWNGEEADRIAVTHVIFKQGGPRTLSKVKLAKGAVRCVGLGWISRYVLCLVI
jgi:hypothetical protein